MAKEPKLTPRNAASGRFIVAKHGKAKPHTTIKETPGAGGGAYRSAVSGRYVTAGKANDGVRVLAPKVKATSFTKDEIRSTIRSLKGASGTGKRK